MTELQRLADQLDHLFTGPTWHGPAVREILAEVSPADALAHPVAGGHSIVELVHHLDTWNRVVDQRLAGGSPDVGPELDWPKPDIESLETAISKLADSHASLTQAIRSLPAERLFDELPGDSPERPTVYVTLQGIGQHYAYHAGQMAILVRALQTASTPAVARQEHA